MRIVFIGTGEIGIPVLRFLLKAEDHQVVGIVTQPAKPVGRDQILQAPPVKTAVSGKNVPVLQPTRIKQEQAVAEIRRLTPDLIIVMAYGQILPQSVLEIPIVACLNLHASLLPRHRGAAPIQAAILAGDRETGITVMYMDEGLDTGDILLQRRIGIASNETGGSLHDKLAQIAPEAVAEAILLLDKEKTPRLSQENEFVTYASKLERKHGRIDWSESAETIERKIRAFDPWPGAFMEIDHRHLKIFSATIAHCKGKPGEISQKENELIVAAGEGALLLGEVQLEGKRRMSAAEFLRGHSRIAQL